MIKQEETTKPVGSITILETVMSTATISPAAPGRALRISLWVAQALVFFVFVSAGIVKFFTPIPMPAALI